jgi:hypothetical protein
MPYIYFNVVVIAKTTQEIGRSGEIIFEKAPDLLTSWPPV